MAHKKAGGSTALGRDSQGQRLGVKLPHGAFAKAVAIIIRQRGTKVFPGQNVMRGKDDTLFASTAGIIKFSNRKKPNFHGAQRWIKIVRVEAAKAKA